MTRSTLIVGAALTVLSLSACGKPVDKTAADTAPPSAANATAPAAGATTATPMAAADFVTKAASTDMFEMTEAKLALKRSTNADVKKFAAMMIADHTKSTENLKAAIAKSGQTITPPPALPAELQAKVDDLTKASAADFDKTYVTQQVDAHQTALGVMQGYGQAGDVPALKEFAANTSTVVQGHLSDAQKMQGSMK